VEKIGKDFHGTVVEPAGEMVMSDLVHVHCGCGAGDTSGGVEPSWWPSGW
jgi:hypothetical protein